jgi:hypothetical protein
MANPIRSTMTTARSVRRPLGAASPLLFAVFALDDEMAASGSNRR